MQGGHKGGRRRKLTPELVADGIRSGLTVAQIAEHAHVHIDTVERTITRARKELGESWPMPSALSSHAPEIVQIAPAALILPETPVLHVPAPDAPLRQLRDFALRRALLSSDVAIALKAALGLLSIAPMDDNAQTGTTIDTGEIKRKILERLARMPRVAANT